jgi:hypothetical protein
MSELTKKVIAAGIVPRQSVELLKKWKLIDPSIPTQGPLEEATQQQLLDFVEEIGELLEGEQELPEMRETMPEVKALFDMQARDCRVVCRDGLTIVVKVLEDAHGSLIFANDHRHSEKIARVGNQVHRLGVVEIVEVMALYFDKNITHWRCRVQGVPEHAQMRNL